MSLEELLRSRIIRRTKPDHNLALNSIKRANRDIDTAKTLIENQKFDWSLAVSYNAMLSAGRAFMFDKGFRPSSSEGHMAVVRFLQTTLGIETSNRMIMMMNTLRKKRHRIVYEEMDIVSKDEAKQMVALAQEFVKTITDLISRKTPHKKSFTATRKPQS